MGAYMRCSRAFCVSLFGLTKRRLLCLNTEVHSQAVPEKAKVPNPSSHDLSLRRYHSARKVCIGSIRDPRCAGTQTAIRATQLKRTGTVINTAGSQLFTPNKKLAIR
jgi:hypothetical protein